MIKVSRTISIKKNKNDKKANELRIKTISSIIHNALQQHLESKGKLQNVTITLSLNNNDEVNLTVS